MSRNLERVSSSSTSSSGGRRGPARPCGRVTTRTVIGPCGRAGATSARAGCFFVFGLDFSRACRCCLLCTCDLIYIRVHRSVCAPRHACCVLLRPATDDSGPFAQCELSTQCLSGNYIRDDVSGGCVRRGTGARHPTSAADAAQRGVHAASWLRGRGYL